MGLFDKTRTYNMSEEDRLKYGSWDLGYDKSLLTDKNLAKALNYMTTQISSTGKIPTQKEFDSYMKQHSDLGGNEYKYITKILKDNYDKVGGLSIDDNGNLVYNAEADPNSSLYSGSTDPTSADYLNKLADDAYRDRVNMNTDINSTQSQRYLQDIYGAIDREQALDEAVLSNAEIDAYKQIGYQQQELENTIAENRMKALKSGTTSAQLAAQQLQNMFAAQSGAAQVAGNVMNQRISNAQNFANQRTQAYSGLYDTINTNKQTLATAGAQNYAASTGYMSYVNQQLASLQANQKLYNQVGKSAYQDILGVNSR